MQGHQTSICSKTNEPKANLSNFYKGYLNLDVNLNNFITWVDLFAIIVSEKVYTKNTTRIESYYFIAS